MRIFLFLLLATSFAYSQTAGDYRETQFQGSGTNAATKSVLYQLAGKNVVYVSKSAGATDTRTNLSKYDDMFPFATLAAAVSAAASGDTITVGPGEYAVTDSILKNGVNWYFYPGTRVENTTNSIGPLSDKGAAITCEVAGYGVFSLTDATLVGTVSITNASSNITIYCSGIESIGNNCCAIYTDGGKLFVQAPIINGDYCSVYWNNGDTYIHAQEIFGGYSALWFGQGDPIVGSLYVSANRISIGGTPTQNPSAVIYNEMVDPEGTVWIDAQLIEPDGVISKVFMEGLAGGGRVYIRSEKLIGKAVLGDGLMYIDSQKWSAISGSQFLTATDGTVGGLVARINIGQWEDGGATGNVFDIGGDTTLVELGAGDFVSTAANGILKSGDGTLRINAMRIDTQAVNTTSPITKSGGGNLILNSAVLLANASRDSISASAAVNVISYNSFANRPFDSDVTIQAGTLSISSDVQ